MALFYALQERRLRHLLLASSVLLLPKAQGVHDAVLVFDFGDEEHLRDHVAFFVVCINVLVIFFDFGNLGIGVLCILANNERYVLLFFGS